MTGDSFIEDILIVLIAYNVKDLWFFIYVVPHNVLYPTER